MNDQAFAKSQELFKRLPDYQRLMARDHVLHAFYYTYLNNEETLDQFINRLIDYQSQRLRTIDAYLHLTLQCVDKNLVGYLNQELNKIFQPKDARAPDQYGT